MRWLTSTSILRCEKHKHIYLTAPNNVNVYTSKKYIMVTNSLWYVGIALDPVTNHMMDCCKSPPSSSTEFHKNKKPSVSLILWTENNNNCTAPCS